MKVITSNPDNHVLQPRAEIKPRSCLKKTKKGKDRVVTFKEEIEKKIIEENEENNVSLFEIFLEDLEISLLENQNEEIEETINYVKKNENIFENLNLYESKEVTFTQQEKAYHFKISRNTQGWTLEIILRKDLVQESYIFNHGQWQKVTKKIIEETKEEVIKNHVCKVAENISSPYVVKPKIIIEEKNKKTFIEEKTDGSLDEFINPVTGIEKNLDFFNIILLSYTAALGLTDEHAAFFLHENILPKNICYVRKGSFNIAKIGGLKSSEKTYALESNKKLKDLEVDQNYSSEELKKAKAENNVFVYCAKDDVVSLAKVLYKLCKSWLNKNKKYKHERIVADLINLFSGVIKHGLSNRAGQIFLRIKEVLDKEKDSSIEMQRLSIFIDAQSIIGEHQAFVEKINTLLIVDRENREYLQSLKMDLSDGFPQLFAKFCQEDFSELTAVEIQKDLNQFKESMVKFKKNLWNAAEKLEKNVKDCTIKFHFIKNLLKYDKDLTKEINQGKEIDWSIHRFFDSRYKTVKKKSIQKLFDYFETGKEPCFDPAEISASKNGRLKAALGLAKGLNILPRTLYGGKVIESEKNIPSNTR